jgi:hypothetical protein
MNRKVAVAAIVGGLMHTMSVLRGQEVQPVPARVRPPVGELLPPQGIAPLTPAVADDLQRQINELSARVNVLAQAQANTVGFTKVGNDFVFAPTSGNVSIKAPMNLKIEGAALVDLRAASTLTIRGDGTVDLRATGTLQQRGAIILIN